MKRALYQQPLGTLQFRYELDNQALRPVFLASVVVLLQTVANQGGKEPFVVGEVLLCAHTCACVLFLRVNELVHNRHTVVSRPFVLRTHRGDQERSQVCYMMNCLLLIRRMHFDKVQRQLGDSVIQDRVCSTFL